jgi:TRAP-type C4-dicarboxylate transport system permease small subunit
VIVAYLLLAAPVIAALLLWGSWGWVAAAVVIAAVQYATLVRSQRFSARFWRSVGVTQRSRRERGIEIVYVISAVAGVGILFVALLELVGSASHGR